MSGMPRFRLDLPPRAFGCEGAGGSARSRRTLLNVRRHRRNLAPIVSAQREGLGKPPLSVRDRARLHKLIRRCSPPMVADQTRHPGGELAGGSVAGAGSERRGRAPRGMPRLHGSLRADGGMKMGRWRIFPCAVAQHPGARTAPSVACTSKTGAFRATVPWQDQGQRNL